MTTLEIHQILGDNTTIGGGGDGWTKQQLLPLTTKEKQ